MGSKPVALSASRGAAILGLSDYTTRFEVWQMIQEERNPGFNEKLGYTLPVFEGNAFTRFGHAFEDSIIELAEERRGKKIEDRERLFTGVEIDEKYNFITCHIDGWYADDSDYFELHEGKTTTQFSFRLKWGDPGTDRVPQDYQVQAQHQMLCTGAEEVIFSVLVFPEMPTVWEEMGWKVEQHGLDAPNGPWYLLVNGDQQTNPFMWALALKEMGFFHQFIVPRNQELIDQMVEKYTQFWEENILGGQPPEPANIKDIERMIPNPCGTVIVNDSLANWIREYKDINTELGPGGQMSKRKDQLKVLILDTANKMHKEIDEDSAYKFLIKDTNGDKLCTFTKTKAGTWMFR